MAESEDKDKGTTLTVAELKKYIGDTVASIVANIKPDEGKPTDKDTKTDDKGGTGLSIKEQVQRELDRIKAQTDKETRDKTIDEKLTELFNRTAEKTPVERRRVHRFMGWGE